MRIAGKRYHVAPHVLAGLIEQESGDNPNAVSSAGAFGLTQFLPSTARGYHVRRGSSHGAKASQILGAAHYLHDLGYSRSRQKALGGYYGSVGASYKSEVLNKAKAYYKKGLFGGGGGKGYRRTRGGKRTTLEGKLRTIPGVSHAADRQQAKLGLLSQSGSKMPSQGQLLNLAGQLRDMQDEPAQQTYDISRKTVRTKGGRVPAGGGKGYPHGVGAHGTPNLLIHIGHLAQKMGLHVGENPNFGGVGGSHVSGSYHYKNEAIDVSGDARKMARFAKVVQRRYGRHLAELIHNSPYGAFAVKHGKRVPHSFYSGVWAGHRNHVHIAVGRGGRGTA